MEKYITFTREMARAYRDGRKKMTRRVMRVQPPSDRHVLALCSSSTDKQNRGKYRWVIENELRIRDPSEYFCCPYGSPGDQIIMGTTWAVSAEYDHLKPTDLPRYDGSGLHDCAPIDIWSYFESDDKPDGFGKLRPARFPPGLLRDRMPRETLTIVRAERIQDITPAEIKEEGIRLGTVTDDFTDKLTPAFIDLWDSINLKRGYGWDTNPCTWVLGWGKS